VTDVVSAPSAARPAALGAMVITGALLAFVAPIDGGLSHTTGALPAALWDFIGGAFVILSVLAVTGQLPRMVGALEAPRMLLLGGACGAAFVTAGVVTIGPLGAGGVAAATVTGQMIAALLIDRFGLLGLARTPITSARLVGVACVVGGTLLITTG
jgi:transporter family-2 protein